jgi:hypothetical protein
MTKYTPNELRAQVPKMHPGVYPDGRNSDTWLMNVGIGTGMLIMTAKQLEAAYALLKICEGYLVDFNLHNGDEYQGGLGDAINSVRAYLYHPE